MSISSAITSSLRNYTYSVCLFYPFGCAQHETRQTCLHSKVVKFDHIKIRIVYDLPRAQELQSTSISNPIFDNIGSTRLIMTSSTFSGKTSTFSVEKVNLFSTDVYVFRAKMVNF